MALKPVLPGNVVPVPSSIVGGPYFTPESYGATGNGTTDDTVAIQSAITAAEAVQGTVVFKGVTYKITAALTASNAVTLRGAFSAPVVGGVALHANNFNAPYFSPYLQGTVLLMVTANTNGLNIPAVGVAVNIINIGIRFDDSIKFRSTGHGIYCYPPEYIDGSGNHLRDNGIFNSYWSGVNVYGNDANHSGIWITNGLYNVVEQCSITGGTCFTFENNSPTYTGNMTLNGCWFWMIGSGIGNGIRFLSTSRSTTGGSVDHISFFNVQCLGINDLSTGFGGAITGDTTNGSNVLTNLSSTAGIVLGQLVTGGTIPANSWVSALTDTTITLSSTTSANWPLAAASYQDSNCSGTASGVTFTVDAANINRPHNLLVRSERADFLCMSGCSFEPTGGGVSGNGGVYFEPESTGQQIGPTSILGPTNIATLTGRGTGDLPLQVEGISFGRNFQPAPSLRMILPFDYPKNSGNDLTAYTAGWGFDAKSLVHHVQYGDTGFHRFGALDPDYQTFADYASKYKPWVDIKSDGIHVQSGSNYPAGTFTLSSGSATVSNTCIDANSVVLVTLKTASGTRAGNPDIVPNSGVGFTATGAATDNGTYNYVVMKVQ